LINLVTYADNNRIVLFNNLAKYALLLICFSVLHFYNARAQCGLTLVFTEGPQVTTPNLECPSDCNGLIVVAPSGGGGAPFTYLWDDPAAATLQAAQNLCAGVYNVTITDAVGCVTVAQDSIVAPPPVVPTFTQTQTCFGTTCPGGGTGTATLTVTGGCSGSGTCSYPFVWTNVTTSTTIVDTLDATFVFGNLCAGDYTVSVTDIIPCPAVVQNITITSAPTPLSIANNSSTDPTCPGDCDGSATVEMSGSQLPYTFAWSTGQTTFDPGPNTINLLCDGSYSVTITDSLGCIENQAYTITDPPNIVTAPSSTDPTCGLTCNGTATPNASGGTPNLAYAWSDGQTSAMATVLCAGSYTVTVTDNNNCTEIESFVLSQPAGLESTASSGVECAGGGAVSVWAAVQPSTGIGPYTYIWSDPDVQTTQTATGLIMGQSYSATILDATGCRFDTTFITTTKPCPLVIPNTFSPNGDGFNDTWIIENLILYTEAKLKVYNRWGDIVYSSTGYDTPWEGRSVGTILPAAVYYYVLNVDEIGENYAGSVTIVK